MYGYIRQHNEVLKQNLRIALFKHKGAGVSQQGAHIVQSLGLQVEVFDLSGDVLLPASHMGVHGLGVPRPQLLQAAQVDLLAELLRIAWTVLEGVLVCSALMQAALWQAALRIEEDGIATIRKEQKQKQGRNLIQAALCCLCGDDPMPHLLREHCGSSVASSCSRSRSSADARLDER